MRKRDGNSFLGTLDMTAPTAEPVSTSDDFSLAHALNAAAERNGRPFLGAPEESPAQSDPETPAPDAAVETDMPAADSPTPDATATPETPAPDGSTAPDTPAPDPLDAVFAAGNPLTYKVDGTSKTFDGIVEVAGKGAFIKPDALDRVRDTLQRAEHATEANRTLYAKTQEYEAAGGTTALYTLQEEKAALNAIVVQMANALDNLDRFLVPNGQGGFAVDERARDLFFREIKLEAESARRTVAGQRETQALERQTAAQDEQATTEGIRLAVESLADGLAPEDVAEATAFFARFAGSLVKQATPDVALQYGMKVGEKYVDRALMVDWFDKRRETRTAQRAEAEARRKAEAFNAQRAPVKAVTPPKPRPAPAQPRAEDGTFREKPKRLDASTIFERAMAGKPISGADSYETD